MKKLLILLALLGPVWKPALARAGANVISGNRVVISTQPTGTLILAADQGAKSTCLMNSTTNYFMIADVSAAFSISATTGTSRVPATVASTNPNRFCLDGPNAPYTGAVYGVSGAAGDMTVDAWRTK